MRPKTKPSAPKKATKPAQTPPPPTNQDPLLQQTIALREALAPLRFREPVTHVYQPLDYAWSVHQQYLTRFGQVRPREMLWLGMNPGPWGMAQTGVPFGHIPLVRDWMKLSGEIQHPPNEHPKRPVEGFDCKREEVSGARLWGWAQQRAPNAEDFFQRIFLTSYCPLLFLEQSGRNRTPDKLHADEREALFAICDQALVETVSLLAPQRIIAIGRFAKDRLERALGEQAPPIIQILHPSPASPAANRGWVPAIEKTLHQHKISLDFPATSLQKNEPF